MYFNRTIEMFANKINRNSNNKIFIFYFITPNVYVFLLVKLVRNDINTFLMPKTIGEFT